MSYDMYRMWKNNKKMSEESKDASTYYKVRETAIPNPDLELQGFLGSEDAITELKLQYSGSEIYRLVRTWEITDGRITGQHFFIQILGEPYESWETYEILPSYWKQAYSEVSEEDVFRNYFVDNIYVVNENVYCDVRITSKGKEAEEWLGIWKVEEPGKLLREISSNSSNTELQMYNNQFYEYEAGGNKLSQLNETLQNVKTYTLSGNIYGLFYEESKNTLFWYGVQDKNFGIWRVGDNSLLTFMEQINIFSLQDVYISESENGSIFVMDRENLWRLCEGGAAELVSDFSKQDYLLDFIYGMSMQEETVMILAEFDGRRYLLSAQEEERVREYQEIVIAAVEFSSNSSLQKMISRFNRRNGKYHITLLTPTGSDEDFKQQMQMELSIGKGPDLFLINIADNTIDVEGAARNGFLQSMEGILEDEEAFWPAALDCGRIDGVLYGIPYECQLDTLYCPREMVSDYSSWTVENMMDMVTKSDAEKVASHCDGLRIVLLCGIMDKSNKNYIDWEKGVSHLTEAPFLNFLKFVKEYRDDDFVKVSKYAMNMEAIDTFSRMQSCKKYYKGSDIVFVGYPSAEGGVHYIMCTNLYMNSASENQEGIKTFINYLLSEECMKEYAEYTPVMPVETFHAPYLPVRLSALEYSITLLLNNSTSGFTEEDAQAARRLLENARPMVDDTEEVLDIIADEVRSYFNGDMTLEEAAKIMDNRVQLYLNEKK